MSVKERIKQFAKAKNISIREFERVTGLNYGYVNAIRVSMQPDKIDSIASYFKDLNIEWLLTGKGEMLINEGAESNITTVSNNIVMPREVFDEIIRLNKIIESQQRTIESMQSKKDTADIA